MIQEPELNFKVAVVRNIENNDAYMYLGNDRYRNIRTRAEGVVNPEMAAKIFRVNGELTKMISANPNIERLINALNLKIEPKQ